MIEQINDIVEKAGAHLGFAPTISINGEIDAITKQLGEQLAPALTESLSNVARHAQATAVDITLNIAPETISLAVADDGVGIDPDAPRGNGLDNLLARARQLGGTLTVDSHANHGTTLTMVLTRS
jgi:two-component system sensor histidine kinase DevS